MDEQGEAHQLSKLKEKQEVTLCVDVEEGGAGKTLDLFIDAPKDKKFKGNKIKLEYKNLLIEDDNTAYVDKFKVEYE